MKKLHQHQILFRYANHDAHFCATVGNFSPWPPMLYWIMTTIPHHIICNFPSAQWSLSFFGLWHSSFFIDTEMSIYEIGTLQTFSICLRWGQWRHYKWFFVCFINWLQTSQKKIVFCKQHCNFHYIGNEEC